MLIMKLNVPERQNVLRSISPSDFSHKLGLVRLEGVYLATT